MRRIKLDDVIEETISIKTHDDIKAFTASDFVNNSPVKTYHSKEIQACAEVSESQLKHWTITGVLHPYQAVKGTGRMHLYDHQNLIEAMICKELSQYSINFRVMREILAILRGKKWIFKLFFSIVQDEANRNDTRIERQYTIWERFKIAPLQDTFSLILWKDSPFIDLSSPRTGDLNFYVTTDRLDSIIGRCKSSIVITLSRLPIKAGLFCKEGDN